MAGVSAATTVVRMTSSGTRPASHGEDKPMELRYQGFEQLQNARGYRFDLVTKGSALRQFVVTVDLALFRTHAVGIQEGPSLCAQKLLADLENRFEGDHQLTTEDL